MFINKINIDNSKKIPLKAICLSVPAIININSGEIVSASLFKGWEKPKLKEILTNKFNLKVCIENSTNMSAKGE